jgi:uncharacterized protein YigE (DUF2233 family)
MFNKEKKYLLLRVLFLIAIALYFTLKTNTKHDDQFVSFTVNPQKQNLQFYWKNDSNVAFKSIANLQNWLTTKNKALVFAMNGGMYQKDNSPQGLYIENYVQKSLLGTNNGKGNFFMMPNGLFYMNDKNEPFICTTTSFLLSTNIKFATQSGPMLLVDGHIHPQFIKGSTNINIRNGVGILPNNEVLFAMSKKEINFYDFAHFFKEKGCLNALYLDGFVSRTFLPEENWIQNDGNFGVIIGVTKSKN